MQHRTPAEIASAAEQIYDEQFREHFERDFHDHFVVIDITTGEGYRHQWPEKAFENARKKAPKGVFYMIRIGSPGAFRVSYTMENAYARAL